MVKQRRPRPPPQLVRATETVRGGRLKGTPRLSLAPLGPGESRAARAPRTARPVRPVPGPRCGPVSPAPVPGAPQRDARATPAAPMGDPSPGPGARVGPSAETRSRSTPGLKGRRASGAPGVSLPSVATPPRFIPAPKFCAERRAFPDHGPTARTFPHDRLANASTQ